MACEKCVLAWLPAALKTGKMKYATLHPRIKAILDRHGYDKNGDKKITVMK